MNCTICLNEGSDVIGMYNDCVIMCLEKIKTHYINLKKQINDNEMVIATLKQTNGKLEETVDSYEQAEKNSDKKRRRGSAGQQKDDGRDLDCSEIFDNAVADKSIADLNMALNDENEFEVSFIPNTPLSNEKSVMKREPMKVISLSPKNSSATNTKFAAAKNIKNNENYGENKRTGGWISKENEIRRSLTGSFRNPDKNARNVKREYKSTNLSLKAGRLRQTRLQLSIVKNDSNAGDTTFFDESIEASPKSETSLRKINTSRNASYEIKGVSGQRLKTEKITYPNAKEKVLDTSSVVFLTPATQDIIFLDDSSENFNIESMDLLKDLMNPTESHLSNLRRMESNGIKSLQKTVNEKIDTHANKHPDVQKKQESVYKTEDYIKPNKLEKNHLNADCSKQSRTNKTPEKSHMFKQKEGVSPLKVLKEENHERDQMQRLFNVDCNECQAYIKYLGTHLSDEEIKQHIRNCTKHKKRIEINPTPDGFWNPVIKPLDADDPRNETLIDTRFIGKERRN